MRDGVDLEGLVECLSCNGLMNPNGGTIDACLGCGSDRLIVRHRGTKLAACGNCRGIVEAVAGELAKCPHCGLTSRAVRVDDLFRGSGPTH